MPASQHFFTRSSHSITWALEWCQIANILASTLNLMVLTTSIFICYNNCFYECHIRRDLNAGPLFCVCINFSCRGVNYLLWSNGFMGITLEKPMSFIYAIYFSKGSILLYHWCLMHQIPKTNITAPLETNKKG